MLGGEPDALKDACPVRNVLFLFLTHQLTNFSLWFALSTDNQSFGAVELPHTLCFSIVLLKLRTYWLCTLRLIYPNSCTPWGFGFHWFSSFIFVMHFFYTISFNIPDTPSHFHMQLLSNSQNDWRLRAPKGIHRRCKSIPNCTTPLQLCCTTFHYFCTVDALCMRCISLRVHSLHRRWMKRYGVVIAWNLWFEKTSEVHHTLTVVKRCAAPF